MAWHPFRNLRWKALAVVFATALWALVSRDLAIERTIDGRPVTLRNAAAGVQAVVVPSRATVTLRGSREELSGIQDNEVLALVDLAGLGPGQYRLPLHVDVPSTVQVAKTTPETVTVEVRLR